MTHQLLTPYQSQYYAWLLTRRAAADSVESGHDNDRLNVANLPMAEPLPSAPQVQAPSGGKKAPADRHTTDLFGDAVGKVGP